MTYEINNIIMLLINNYVCILSRHGVEYFLYLYLKYFLNVFDIFKYVVVLRHVKDAYMPFTYMLNYKSIHPHSIERQNVKLALRIFHVNNAAALRTLGPHNETLSKLARYCFVH